MTFSSTVAIHASLDAKARRPGTRKWFRHVRSGASLTKATGEWNELHRDIDRANNSYEEKVIERNTGRILRLIREPLSEHRGRGSARMEKLHDTSQPSAYDEDPRNT